VHRAAAIGISVAIAAALPIGAIGATAATALSAALAALAALAAAGLIA
jgi:hypothetical protein